MYSYYIMSTFESLKPYLWWKKYVTAIQLTQFIILGVHFSVAALTPNCGYPRILSITGLAISVMFFTLFITFYKETYTRQQKRQYQLRKSLNLQQQQQTIDKNNNNNNNHHNHINNKSLDSKSR